MPCRKGTKQTPQVIINQIIEEHARGGTRREYGILPSMSRPGTPLDNACAENFFGTLKNECIYRHKPATNEEASLLIDDYIQFYNYHRIQLKTKLTPYEKRCQSLAILSHLK